VQQQRYSGNVEQVFYKNEVRQVKARAVCKSTVTPYKTAPDDVQRIIFRQTT
jgi:hypothetical protein